jgi:hypothetical protein
MPVMLQNFILPGQSAERTWKGLAGKIGDFLRSVVDLPVGRNLSAKHDALANSRTGAVLNMRQSTCVSPQISDACDIASKDVLI